MRPVKKQPSRQESTISWIIMGVLALITLGVFVDFSLAERMCPQKIRIGKLMKEASEVLS